MVESLIFIFSAFQLPNSRNPYAPHQADTRHLKPSLLSVYCGCHITGAKTIVDIDNRHI